MKASPQAIDGLVVTGPTASGKTDLVLEWGTLYPDKFEVINSDSLMVYRQLEVGTAKPTPEKLKLVPHHLVNLCDPDEDFSVGTFVRLARTKIQEIKERGKTPVIVGGTGFYLKALLYGLWPSSKATSERRQALESKTDEELRKILNDLDPSALEIIGKRDRYRIIRAIEISQDPETRFSQLRKEKESPKLDLHLWIVERNQEELEHRIQDRTKAMLKNGIIEETKLLQSRYSKSRCLLAVGYRQVDRYLRGEPPQGRKMRAGIDGVQDEIILATRQLVKSQRTWFKSLEKSFPHSSRFLLEADRQKATRSFNLITNN